MTTATDAERSTGPAAESERDHTEAQVGRASDGQPTGDVRAAERMLDQQQLVLARLRTAIMDSEAAETGLPFDLQAFLASQG